MPYDMLLSPMNIGTMTVKNRTVMAAAEFSLGQPNGKPTRRLMDYYEERAKGGVGLIIPGVCRVNDMRGALTFTQLSMSHDYHIEPMREFADLIHAHGAKLAIQLHHPGRQGMASAINSLPFVIPIADRFPKVMNLIFRCTPLLLSMEAKGICFSVQAPSKCEPAKHGATRFHAMSRREIKSLIRDFVDAAERCQKAGVDAVELHGGHGYLIQQFLSPYTNRRTDKYGGSFRNRLRFLEEIILGIRKRCGEDYPIIVRMTADEMYAKVGEPEKGYDIETGKRIAVCMEKLGVNAINVTSACYDAFNYWLEPTTFELGWRKYLAKEIKSVVNIPVIAANVIRTPDQAELQLQEGYQDFVASARTFICDPHWVNKAAEGRPEEIRRCIGCLNCVRSLMTNACVGRPGECALNMSIAHEKSYFYPRQVGAGRKVIVIGAGPAGLTAAHTLALKGCDVEVYEKNDRPGGQVITASACNLRDKLYWSIEDLMTLARKAGAQIHLSTTLTAEEIRDKAPYAVIIATGGVPLLPRSIPGLDLPHVFSAQDVILKKRKIENSRVIVAGSGMTGLETAEILGETGNDVTIIEMASEAAPGVWFQLVDDVMERLKKYNVRILTDTKLNEVAEGRVIVEDVKTKTVYEIPADYVVPALGIRPENALAAELEELGLQNVIKAGDAKRSGTIADACHSAYDAVKNLI